MSMFKNWNELITIRNEEVLQIYKLEPVQTNPITNSVEKYKVSIRVTGIGYKRKISRIAHIVDNTLKIYAFKYNKEDIPFIYR